MTTMATLTTRCSRTARQNRASEVRVEPEGRPKLSHIVPVAIPRLVPLVEVDLLLGRQAADRRVPDPAGDEAPGGVHERPVTLQRCLHSRPIRSEGQRMQVDLPAGRL